MPSDRPISSAYQRIYAVVRRIPSGRVATYGQVAALAGLPGHARQVGYALHALPEGSGVPWQRVINHRGEISARADSFFEPVQRAMLEAEGVVFDSRGRVPLRQFRWEPRGRPGREAAGSRTGRRAPAAEEGGIGAAHRAPAPIRRRR
jgi:methylated-DNA-protein-cysteine methyltransferase-like protein